MSHPFPASKRKTSSRAAMLADGSSPRVLRPAPLRQAVYDAIIELIVQGTLERGRHLVEAELAEYLGVSRQPVRRPCSDCRPTAGSNSVPPRARSSTSPPRRR